MENDNEILNRLNAIPDKEWLEIVDKLTAYVYFKLKGKTLFGAHSEENLGTNPIDYYIDGAIEKIFSLDWKWQYEKYSIIEQLQRTIGSMISANVERYRTKNNIDITLVDNEILAVLAETISDEDNSQDEQYELFKEALEACSKEDEELQYYVMALEECDSFDEMANVLGFEKSKLYVLQKKMTRRVTNYLKAKKETVK